MLNILTDRLPTNTTKLLALCVIPVLFQAHASAVGSASMHVNPGNLNSTDVLKDIGKENPEITYIRIPEDYDDKESIDKLIERLDFDKRTVVISDTHQSNRWDHLVLNERRCKGDLAFFSNNRTILEQL